MKVNNDGNHYGSKIRHFDCSWISNYFDESERLFLAQKYPLRIINISILREHVLFKSWCPALFILKSLLSGWRFAPDFHATSHDLSTFATLIDCQRESLRGQDFSTLDRYPYLKRTFKWFCSSARDIVINLWSIDKVKSKLSGFTKYFVNETQPNVGYKAVSPTPTFVGHVNMVTPAVFTFLSNNEKLIIHSTSRRGKISFPFNILRLLDMVVNIDQTVIIKARVQPQTRHISVPRDIPELKKRMEACGISKSDLWKFQNEIDRENYDFDGIRDDVEYGIGNSMLTEKAKTEMEIGEKLFEVLHKILHGKNGFDPKNLADDDYSSDEEGAACLREKIFVRQRSWLRQYTEGHIDQFEKLAEKGWSVSLEVHGKHSDEDHLIFRRGAETVERFDLNIRPRKDKASAISTNISHHTELESEPINITPKISARSTTQDEDDQDFDTDDEMKNEDEFIPEKSILSVPQHTGNRAMGTLLRKHAGTDIFPPEQGKANLDGARTTNVKFQYVVSRWSTLFILQKLFFLFFISQNFHIYRCTEWVRLEQLTPSQFCRDSEAYELFFDEDHDVPNKLMVHCVGNSKHIIRCQTTSLLAKCLMIGEAVKDNVLDLPPPKEIHHHFILLWNNKEYLGNLANASVQFCDVENHRCALTDRNQRFPNEESKAIYELGHKMVNSMEQRNDLWWKICAGWIWVHFNGQSGITGMEQMDSQAVLWYKNNIIGSDVTMRAIKEMYRQNAEIVNKLRRKSYRVVPKEKTKDDIFWNLIGWISTVPCDQQQCYGQCRIHCECSTENDALFHFVQQMVRVIFNDGNLPDSENFTVKMLIHSLQVPKWGKSYDEATDDLHQLTLKQAIQLICNRHFEGKDKKQYLRYLKDWISMELYNFECWHCGSTNKSIMIDRIYRYSQNMIYCMMCSRIQPGRRKQSAERHIVLNIDSIPTRYDQQDDVPEDEGTVFQCGNLVRYTVHSPKFKSFAEELLLNAVFHLNPSQWFECLERAKKWLQENQSVVQKRQTRLSDVRYGIFRGDTIDIRHIAALYFFTDFPDYAAAFIKSYHTAPEKHCKSFYWMGRFLWEMNHFFGTKLTAEKELYSVASNKSLFDSFAPSVCVPVQAVDDEEVLDYNESTSRILSFRPKYTEIDGIVIDETKYIKTNEWSERHDDDEWFVTLFSKNVIIAHFKKFVVLVSELQSFRGSLQCTNTAEID